MNSGSGLDSTRPISQHACHMERLEQKGMMRWPVLAAASAGCMKAALCCTRRLTAPFRYHPTAEQAEHTCHHAQACDLP